MDSLRIVHCANFSESKYGSVYYAIDRKLSNGFIRNGHFVYDFSYREIAKNATFFKSKKFGAKKVNAALLETLKHIEPHLLLLGHSELITVETLKVVKRLYPHMKIAMWWVDPFEKSNHIPERLPIIDLFFATTGCNYLLKLFGLDTHCSLCFFPNICDPSIEKPLCDTEMTAEEYDLIYIGREDDRRKDFLTFLRSLKDITIGLFGQKKENLLLGHTYYKTLQKAKIALNYSRFNDIELYSSDRMIQLTASGVMVMCPVIPKMETLFTQEEIIYFDGKKDFKEKLYYYLSHEEQRKYIAKNGLKRAHLSFNNQRVSKFMLEKIFNITSTETYEWDCIKEQK